MDRRSCSIALASILRSPRSRQPPDLIGTIDQTQPTSVCKQEPERSGVNREARPARAHNTSNLIDSFEQSRSQCTMNINGASDGPFRQRTIVSHLSFPLRLCGKAFLLSFLIMPPRSRSARAVYERRSGPRAAVGEAATRATRAAASGSPSSLSFQSRLNGVFDA